MEEEAGSGIRRGSAVLIISLIFVSAFAVGVVLPRDADVPGLRVRVCIIDSGITKDASLNSRIVSEKSFINSTYGYSVSVNSTHDSMPLYNPHGTYIAKIIARDAHDAAIVNAKVVTENNTATVEAIVAAIYWAVGEAECDVINLSIGTFAYIQGPLRDAVEWAFSMGVSIVAAAGNNGRGGVAGTSVESPAVYPEVISVGAVNARGSPYDFSARGPLRNRTAKPDISAIGYYSTNGATVFGTSFAAPAVAAAAANLISTCVEAEWQWTPGMIKAILMSTASHLSSEDWEVGAGVLNAERAIEHMTNLVRRDGLPLAIAVSPGNGQYSFERWFVNSTIRFTYSVFCSGDETFTVSYIGNAAKWAVGPTQIQINKIGSFEFSIDIIADEPQPNLELRVIVSSSEYGYIRCRMTFDADVPLARIAFDISHTPWELDSIYGQFREMYELLTRAGIAVEEISHESEITPDNLARYDALFILDPCAWGYTFEQGIVKLASRRTYSAAELNAYWGYWNSGGSLLVVGLGNRSLDLQSANELLSLFGFSFDYDHIPSITITVNGVSSTLLVTNLMEHPTTVSINSFDFVGCSLFLTGNAYPLAQVEVAVFEDDDEVRLVNRTVMAGLEGVGTGRMIVSGTNFMFDNWGLGGLYQSNENDRFLLQMAYWLIGVQN